MNIRGNSDKVKDGAKEDKPIRMEVSTKANMKTELNMDKEPIFGQTVQNTLANGEKTK